MRAAGSFVVVWCVASVAMLAAAALFAWRVRP
jgi:hypothetical protein